MEKSNDTKVNSVNPGKLDLTISGKDYMFGVIWGWDCHSRALDD